MAIRIHQIYYADDQRRSLDPAFTPYDNRTNPRPEWREYHVFRTEWLAGRCQEGDVTGFLSWKFGVKTRVPGTAVVRFIAEHPGYEVYFVNPCRIEPQPFATIWQQAETHHPGILGLTQRIFDAVGIDLDLARFSQPREQVLFCNYWVGTQRFWDAYMAFCEPVYHHIETGLDEADRRLIWSRADRGIDSPYVPFIMERLFSTLLALRPDLRYAAIDAEAHAVRGWRRRVGELRSAVSRLISWPRKSSTALPHPVGAGLQPAQMGTESRGNPVWMSAVAEEPQR